MSVEFENIFAEIDRALEASLDSLALERMAFEIQRGTQVGGRVLHLLDLRDKLPEDSDIFESRIIREARKNLEHRVNEQTKNDAAATIREINAARDSNAS